MLRAVALWFAFGAITARSTPGTPSSARRSAFRPLAWMPSSLVSRTFMGSLRIEPQGVALAPRTTRSVAHRLQVEAARGRCVAGLAGRAAGEQVAERVEIVTAAQHRPDERAHHVPHDRVGVDPELEHVLARVAPFREHDLALEAHVVGLRRREG